MKDKYMDVKSDFQETVRELAEITGWTQQQSEKVLSLLNGLAQRQGKAAARKKRKNRPQRKSLSRR